jgi:DNA repair protein RadC
MAEVDLLGRVEQKPDHLGHRKRLRERFLNEPKALPDYEILELLLFPSSPRRDVKPLAKELLRKFGSLQKVLMASADELMRVDGINEAGAAALKSVQEAASRLMFAEVKEKPVLNSWLKLLDYCRAEMGHLKNEQFRILFLNAKNMLIADEVQQEGTINHTMAYPREIVKRALEFSASSIILMHNHPSGDPTPSKADIDLTEQIVAAAKPLGIKVHDHLIIAETDHFSFKSNMLIA